MFLRQCFAICLLIVVSALALANDGIDTKSVVVDGVAEKNAAAKNQQAQAEKSPASTSDAQYPAVFSPKNTSQTTPAVGVGQGLVTADPVKVIAGLLFVIVFILALAWLMRKLGAVPAMSGQSMRVLSALSVGTREKVVLVDVAGQQILLGVAPGRVSHLQTFDQPVITQNSSAKPLVNEFSGVIKKLMQNNNEEPDEKNTGTHKAAGKSS